MSRASATDELIIGGEPRVDLLPPIVKTRQRGKVLRRNLGFAVVAVVVLVAGGTGVAFWQAAVSQAQLAAVQQRTTELLAEQAKFVEVRQVQDDVDTSIAARQVGSSTEIDWKAYLDEFRAVLPSNVSIDSVRVESSSPLLLFAAPTAPLQAPRIGVIQIVLTSPDLPAVPEWLEAMRELPGYADATPGSITLSGAGGYAVDLTLHINEGALSNRFADPASTEEK